MLLAAVAGGLSCVGWCRGVFFFRKRKKRKKSNILNLDMLNRGGVLCVVHVLLPGTRGSLVGTITCRGGRFLQTVRK